MKATRPPLSSLGTAINRDMAEVYANGDRLMQTGRSDEKTPSPRSAGGSWTGRGWTWLDVTGVDAAAMARLLPLPACEPYLRMVLASPIMRFVSWKASLLSVNMFCA